jgi:uridine kinase
MSSNRITILGVAGGSGSGKTTFANSLQEALGEKAVIIKQDNFYIDQSDKFDEDGGAVNFDHPEALDFSLMGEKLNELKDGKTVQIPIYDFATHSRKKETLEMTPKEFVIVDGTMILSQKPVLDHLDKKIFIQTSEEVRYQRRLKRDIVERGRSEEGVYNQFYKQVAPMHEEWVEPSKENADTVVNGEGPFLSFINDLLAELESIK